MDWPVEPFNHRSLATIVGPDFVRLTAVQASKNVFCSTISMTGKLLAFRRRSLPRRRSVAHDPLDTSGYLRLCPRRKEL